MSEHDPSAGTQPTPGELAAGKEAGERRITRADLIKSYLIWTFFSHSNYNYERLQATAFAHSMTPVIRRLYGGSKEETAAALKRHLVFFNTDPNIGGMIHGATIALEEQRASGKDVPTKAISAMKTGLMGPIAGIGDTINQGILVPLFLALGIGITGISANHSADLAGISGNALGPIVYFVLTTITSLAIGYTAYTQGYYRGRGLVLTLFKSGHMDKVIVGAGVLGNFVLGGLAAMFVTLWIAPSIHTGNKSLFLQQDFLDKIMPGLLPLGLVILTWWLLSRGMHPIKLLVIYLIVSIAGAIPMFGPPPAYVSDACGSSLFQPYKACDKPAPAPAGQGTSSG